MPLLLILVRVLASLRLLALLKECYGFCRPEVLIIRNSDLVNRRGLGSIHFILYFLFKVLQVLINSKDPR